MQERQLEVVVVLTAMGLLYVICTSMLSMIQARDVSLCFSGRGVLSFHVGRSFEIMFRGSMSYSEMWWLLWVVNYVPPKCLCSSTVPKAP
jgi:hypothetical protein